MRQVTPGFLTAGLAATLLLVTPHVGRAETDDALATELAEMASDIRDVVNRHGGGAVAVGGFTAATSIVGSSGPEIQLKLAVQLEELGVVIADDRYRFEVAGNYLAFTHPETRLEGVKVVGRVIDAEDGTTLGEFPRFVFGEETVPRMLGLSLSVPPNADPRARSEAFRDAREHPQSDVQGTRIATSSDSPYAIEVLIKYNEDYEARPATLDDDGRPFVPIHQDEVYGVRLINDADHEVAVNLSIDGINCFHFTEDEGTYWIVAPHSSMVVKGWHKNETTTIEFKVVDFPDTAAASIHLQPSPQIGMISASFSASWDDDAAKPADEGTGRGTGFGAEVQVDTVKVNRNIGHVRDTISVRYER